MSIIISLCGCNRNPIGSSIGVSWIFTAESIALNEQLRIGYSTKLTEEDIAFERCTGVVLQYLDAGIRSGDCLFILLVCLVPV